jgi:single-stranded DNA-binding protein
MSAHVLISGQLFREPEQRTSKSGKPFVTATIRAKDGEASQWWRITAFSETAQAELMRLVDGDACSVQGAFKAELYQPEAASRKSRFRSLQIACSAFASRRGSVRLRSVTRPPGAAQRLSMTLYRSVHHDRRGSRLARPWIRGFPDQATVEGSAGLACATRVP